MDHSSHRRRVLLILHRSGQLAPFISSSATSKVFSETLCPASILLISSTLRRPERTSTETSVSPSPKLLATSRWVSAKLRHLRKMGYAHDLVFGRKSLYLLSYGFRHHSPYSGVRLVEYENRARVSGRDEASQGKHYSGQLAPGGDFGHGSGFLSRVGREKESPPCRDRRPKFPFPRILSRNGSFLRPTDSASPAKSSSRRPAPAFLAEEMERAARRTPPRRESLFFSSSARSSSELSISPSSDSIRRRFSSISSIEPPCFLFSFFISSSLEITSSSLAGLCFHLVRKLAQTVENVFGLYEQGAYPVSKLP